MPQDPAELMPLVYDELRRIAASYVRGERPGQTLQATALVNEAFVRMAAERSRQLQRTHPLPGDRRAVDAADPHPARAGQACAQARWRARARHARRRRAWRLIGFRPVSPRPTETATTTSTSWRSTKRLAGWPSSMTPLARIVELRYFGGLTVEETAEVIGVSPATVKRQWTLARVWLKRALDGEPAHGMDDQAP